MNDAAQQRFDWQGASFDDRARLYRAVKRVIHTSTLSWNDVYAAALGQKATLGSGYEDNFRAGRIARGKASLIFDWLCRAYPDVAASLAAELMPSPPNAALRWDDFLVRHGTYGGFDIVPFERDRLGNVTFADTEPVSDRIIKRGLPFCFKLDADFAGQAIGFQWAREAWYALPLSRQGLFVSVTAGGQHLPWDDSRNAPIPLKEDTDLGRHRFVILTVQGQMDGAIIPLIEARPLTTDKLDSLARLLDAAQTDRWRLYRLNVIFEA